MNKKHILALLILFASWMAFVCYISFSSESIITMIIKKVIYVLVIGIVLPSFFIIRDKKLNGLFSRARGWSVKHTLRECGKNLRVGKNVKFFNPQKIQLGDNCDVADDVVFAPLVKHNGNNYSSEIIVGNNVHFGTQDRIASKDAVIIDDDVLFAAFVHITDHSHDYHDVGLPISKQGVIGKGKVVVKKGAWLAFGCHVLSGVTIGENSVVAANSVVTKDVPPFSVVAGNPARVVSTYNFKTNQWEKVKNA